MRIVFAAFSNGLYGGVKKTYEVAEGLFALGHDVVVWAPNGTPEWLDFDIPIMMKEPSRADILVVAPKWPDVQLRKPHKRVCYVGGRRDDVGYDPERSKIDLNVCVSSWVAQIYKHYKCPISIIPLGFDANIFRFTQFEKKDRFKICYMPRKNGFLVDQLMNNLGHYYRNRIKLKPIDGNTEVEVARIMLCSSIFLALSTWDGFPLPPMEAMLCGALVIGFSAGGGTEYLKSGENFIEINGPVSPQPIINDEILISFSTRLTNALESSNREIRENALAFAAEYTLEREAKSWEKSLLSVLS